MADKAPQPSELGSGRGLSGGRSTQQKSVTRGHGGEDCGPRLLPAKAVLGSSGDRRPRDTCSPCCERKALHAQSGSTVWPWDSYVNVNGVSVGSADGGLQERLQSRACPREEERCGAYSGPCCPSKAVEEPAARSTAASPRPWNIPPSDTCPRPWSTPASDKLPGTLRSWTSTVSR